MISKMTARTVAGSVSIIVIAEGPWIFIPPIGLPRRSPTKGAIKTATAIMARCRLLHSLAQPMHPAKQQTTPIKMLIPNSS